MEQIEFIVPAYGRPTELRACLSSIFAQRNDNYLVHLIADTDFEGLSEVVDIFKNDTRFRVTILEKRYNDWGHTPRNYGLDHAIGEWVVMTGDDNYYAPIFVGDFLDVAKRNPEVNFVYCDFVLNGPNGVRYSVLVSEPRMGRIDIGNFMVRRSTIGDQRLDTSVAAADGKFVREYVHNKPKETIKKVNKVLYVHN